MDDGLKQRMVGAVVLIAIAVLFVPVLFERSSERELDLSSQIPAEPVIVPEPLTLPSPSPQLDFPTPKPLGAPPEAQTAEAPGKGIIRAEPDPDTEISPPAAEQPGVATEESLSTSRTTEPGAKPLSDSTPPAAKQSQASLVPGAWSIQVGSFSEESRAMALAERLLKDDFRAYVREVQSGGKAYHRVYVGPKLNRADAEAEKRRLDQSLGANTLIVQFES